MRVARAPAATCVERVGPREHVVHRIDDGAGPEGDVAGGSGRVPLVDGARRLGKLTRERRQTRQDRRPWQARCGLPRRCREPAVRSALRPAAIVRVAGRARADRRSGSPRCRSAPRPAVACFCGSAVERGEPLSQREERRGQIAAVDGRDISGMKRRQRRRVVPIEEMALVPLQPFERRQRQVRAAGRAFQWRCSRDRGRPASTAAPCRCWSAKFAGRAAAASPSS